MRRALLRENLFYTAPQGVSIWPLFCFQAEIKRRDWFPKCKVGISQTLLIVLVFKFSGLYGGKHYKVEWL